MIRHLKIFFYPVTLTYSYNKSKDVVVAQIGEVLNRKVTWLSSQDIKGSFLNRDTFEIEIVHNPFSGGIKYNSSLVGQVIEYNYENTLVKTKTKPSIAMYIIFFVSIFLGLVSLVQFIQTSSTKFLIQAIIVLILGPSFSIWYSNVTIAAIRLRYKMYIDKELST